MVLVSTTDRRRIYELLLDQGVICFKKVKSHLILRIQLESMTFLKSQTYIVSLS